MRNNIVNAKNFFLLLIGIALLGACSSNANSTQQTVSIAATNADASTATPSIPTIQITGDLTATVDADNFYIATVKSSDESIIGMMLYMNQDDTRIVYIRFPLNAAPGTYPINQGYTEDFNGTTATGNYVDQTAESIMQFAATGGTLTLDTAGEIYTGHYEFTAADETGKTVTISGVFNDIPYEPPAS
jgi:hypothetical protein